MSGVLENCSSQRQAEEGSEEAEGQVVIETVEYRVGRKGVSKSNILWSQSDRGPGCFLPEG